MKNLIGKKFGRLTPLGHVKKINASGKTVILWDCKCECGKNVLVFSSNLVTGNTSSCGCIRIEKITKLNTKHGMNIGRKENHKLPKVYSAWKSMKERCYSVKNKKYFDYGGRGISVCPQWRDSFENFYKDMGDPPTPKHTLDRINNNGNYEPVNCRWATIEEQANNKRCNRKYLFEGEMLTAPQLSKKLGISSSCVTERAKNGVSLYEPVKTWKNKHATRNFP